MRDARAPARLEDRDAGTGADAPVTRVADDEDAVASLPRQTRDAREGDRDDEPDEAVFHAFDQREREADSRLVGEVEFGERGGHPIALAGEQRDGLSGIGETEQRERRQQQRGGVQIGQGARVPRLQAQPEVQAHAAVQPGDDQQNRLKRALLGDEFPQDQHDVDVAVFDAVEFVEQPRADDMLDQQDRDDQAEHDLAGLPARHAQRAPLVEPPQHQRQMGRHGAVQRHGADRIAPQREEPRAAALELLERDQAERMVGQMRRDISEQHQARPQPQPSDHGPALATVAGGASRYDIGRLGRCTR